ncbi:MAG: uroporphyrinogen-III synthase [Actinomyces sp.]|uniref:uroporphyrinogen-III synthase n=1 Tax=Actinomyces sp. TaxID=29317 RepID=UPI0026DD50DE|nr:uroporphyrinogen-III synthase [Actinomyces sp.]MDO4243857.1 uroporphyrinogen-III synthase [Actinomyces sp.]
MSPGAQSPEDSPSPLAGRCVLLPRTRRRDGLAGALRQAGAEVFTAELAVTVPVPGARAALSAALDSTGRHPDTDSDSAGEDGEDTWLVLTSARALEALDPGDLPAAMPVAAVGPATAEALRELTGRSPDLVAAGSAAALLSEPALSAPRGRGRVVLPCSAIAPDRLARGLRERGWRVEVLPVYTTATADPAQVSAGLRRAWRGGRFDAVVLTAGSSAQALIELLGPPPPGTRVVALGPSTAARARRLGLSPHAVAAAPLPAQVREAVVSALNHCGGQETP